MNTLGVRRTAIGIALQAAKLTGRPYDYPKYTTLNEALAINETLHQDLTTLPNLGYLAIGRGAHRHHIEDQSGLDVIDAIPHETTDTGLFMQLPFVMRQLNNDLSPEDRRDYALRRKETHNGEDYWCYYLKRIKFDKVAPEIFHDNTQDGVTTSRPFAYTSNDLNPVPPELPPEGVVVTSADVIRISSKFQLHFDERDTSELYNVMRIKYNSKSAVISELAICSGTDKEVSIEIAGGNAKMKEAIGVQVIAFISTHYDLSKSNRGFIHEFEFGEGEPLITRGETRPTRYSTDAPPSAIPESLKGTVFDASNRRRAGVSTTSDMGRPKD